MFSLKIRAQTADGEIFFQYSRLDLAEIDKIIRRTIACYKAKAYEFTILPMWLQA